MSVSLYPLRFDPIYQYRLWGGRRLENLLSAPLPDGTIGEAWVLSDRDDFPSRVMAGSLKGQTIKELLAVAKEPMFGKLAEKFDRFPLLLKYLDAREMLSVQVHPSDADKEYLPPGEMGKTEAWVVLETGPDSSINAGLTPGATAEGMRAKLANQTVEEDLASFAPKVGDGVFLHAGTVHALGGGVVVFEVQQNSDVTFRLYDWNRVDAKTGKPRDLQIEQAIACTDFSKGAVSPVTPTVLSTTPVHDEQMFSGTQFELRRLQGDQPFEVGAPDEPRVLVCVEGSGHVDYAGQSYAIDKGDVMFLAAALGVCTFKPSSQVTVFEIAVPLA